MKNTLITVIIILFLLTACDDVGNLSNNSPADSNPDSNTYIPYTIAYSAAGPDISQFLGWEWAKEGSDFKWLFQTDGTVSVIHCCGDVHHMQYNYLFKGNILITYGYETSFDELVVTKFTMADDGLSFTRGNGTKFNRGAARDTSGSTLDLSNDLLGTWLGEDGTEYVFGSDTGLRIKSEQYGYLVRYAELLPLGPLVDGTDAVLEKYKFNRKENKLYLRCADDQQYTLSLSE
jgi:hypothetical protein